MRWLHFTFAALWLTVSVSSSLHASEEALEAIPQPPDSNLQIATINLLQNGQRMSIANLSSKASVSDIIEFYESAWAEPVAEGLPGHIVDTADEWTIISRPTEEWHQVIQLKESAEGVSGQVSVMQLALPIATQVALPLPNLSLIHISDPRDRG